MAEVIIETEEEVDQGWKFLIAIQSEGDSTTAQQVAMTLSWADYNHWSTGTRSPSTIATKVIHFFLANLDAGDQLPPRFDASITRRRFKNVDAALRGA